MTCKRILSNLVPNINTNTRILKDSYILSLHMVEGKCTNHFLYVNISHTNVQDEDL